MILGSTPTPSMDQLMGSNNFASANSAVALNSQQQHADVPAHVDRSLSAKTPSLEIEQPFSMLSTTGSVVVPSNAVPPVGDFLLGESSGYAPNASINAYVMKSSVMEPSSSVIREQVCEAFSVNRDSQVFPQPIAGVVDRSVGNGIGPVSVKVRFIVKNVLKLEYILHHFFFLVKDMVYVL